MEFSNENITILFSCTFSLNPTLAISGAVYIQREQRDNLLSRLLRLRVMLLSFLHGRQREQAEFHRSHHQLRKYVIRSFAYVHSQQSLYLKTELLPFLILIVVLVVFFLQKQEQILELLRE